MQIQQINNYQNNCKYRKITVNINPAYRSNNQPDISFKGTNGLDDLLNKLNEAASKLINKTTNEIISSIQKDNKRFQKISGSFQEIEQKTGENIDYINDNYFFTKKRIRKVHDQEFVSKQEELIRLSMAVQDAKITAGANQLKAENLSIELEKQDPVHAIRRHQKIKQQYPGFDKVGFERIAGYPKEKNVLEITFFKLVDLEKAGEKVDIPHIAFFGPTGNGKTTFTEAVGQETGCPVVPIPTAFPSTPKRQEKFMDILETEGQKSEERFQKDRTRTILFVDELTNVINKESTILEKFTNFAKTCSEKYHCTLLSATNHPRELGIDLAQNDIIPVKISDDPPTKEDTVRVFQHYLKESAVGDINYNHIADTLIQIGEQKGGTYSNSQIENIVVNSFKEGKTGLSQSDVLEHINTKVKNEVDPAITAEVRKSFDEDCQKYMTGS